MTDPQETATGSARRRYWLRDETPLFADPTDDAFGVAEVVDRLVPLIAAADPPFTLALSGSWGAGKTTIARELTAQLSKVGVPCCGVDLWTEDVSQLRRTLVIEVAAALDLSDDKDTVRTNIAKRLDRASRVAVAKQLPPDIELSDLALKDNTHAAYAIAVGGAVVLAGAFLLYAILRDPPLIPVASALFTPAAVFATIRSGLVVRISNAVATEQPAEAQVATQQEFRTIVAAPEGVRPKPVLVVVDNLDRLPAADAVLALREIRSFMEIERSQCVFLVPIDRNAFVGSLEPRLHDEARDYLEKFFNLDIALTMPEPIDLRDWARRLLESVLTGDGIETRQFYDVAQLLVTGAGGSPRAIKRLINAISTRFQLLAPARRQSLTLSQLALAEALAIRFPTLIETFAREAGQFLDSRARLLEVPNRTPRDDFDWMFTRSEEDQKVRDDLVRLLLATSYVTLTVDDLRDILSARVDRFWVGVAEPSRVVEALASGEPSAVDAVLKELEPEARTLALYRMVDYTTKSTASRYYGNAITYANAVAPVCLSEGVHVDQLREATQTALFQTTPAQQGLGRLLPKTIELVFSGREGQARAQGLWRAASRAVPEPNLGPSETAALVLCVRQGAPHVGAKEQRDAQGYLVKAPFASLDPLFDPPVVGDLVNGQIADLYAGQLAAEWDVAADQSNFAVMANRLRIAHEHGWPPATLMPPVGARVVQQLPHASTLSPGARSVLDALMPIFASTPQPTPDQVAAALVGWTGGTNQVDALAWALSLPRSSAAGATKARVEAWLASATVADIEALLARSREQLLAADVNVAAPLLARWMTSDDPSVGLLAVRNRAPSEAAALVATLDGVSSAQYFTRLNVVLSWAGELSNEDLAALVAHCAVKLATLSGKDLDSGREAVAAFHQAGTDIGPIADAAVARVAAADAAGLKKWSPIVEALRARAPAHEPQLRSAMAGRSAALGMLPLVSAPWLFERERTNEGDPLLNAYCARIRDVGTNWDPLLQSLQRTRAFLAHAPSVQAALVARAHAVTDCAVVKPILAEAARWDGVRGSARVEFDQQLTAVATRCSDATSEIVALRGRHGDADGSNGPNDGGADSESR